MRRPKGSYLNITSRRARSLLLVILPRIKDSPCRISAENDNLFGCTNFLCTINVGVFPRLIAPNNWHRPISLAQGHQFPYGFVLMSDHKLGRRIRLAPCNKSQSKCRLAVTIEVNLCKPRAGIAMILFEKTPVL